MDYAASPGLAGTKSRYWDDINNPVPGSGRRRQLARPDARLASTQVPAPQRPWDVLTRHEVFHAMWNALRWVFTFTDFSAYRKGGPLGPPRANARFAPTFS